MFRANILLVTSFSILISISMSFYDEMYRPQLHYSPKIGWLSDPNGLIYWNGKYHLYHQCRDENTSTGAMQWGHAVSTDLIHWEQMPTALKPNIPYAYYSGGGILDHKNSSGLQENAAIPPLIVFICVSNKTTLQQHVWMAYSIDPDYNEFKLYKDEPLIKNKGLPKYFRDPMPIRYKDHYILIVSVKICHAFYKSYDLIKWELVSNFGENEGAHDGGSWEMPSLFPYTVTIDGKECEKYVLTNTRTSFRHPIHQYFIGSFDGEKFTNENSPNTVLWLDYGPDSFAGCVWYDTPDKRRLWINWMGRWEYALSLKENAWNGQMGVTRELKLIQVDGKLRLTSFPVREVENLRFHIIRAYNNVNISTSQEFDIAQGNDNKKHLVDIEMTLNLANFADDNTFDLIFCGPNDELKISYKKNEFTLDRSKAGNSSIPNAHYAQDTPTEKRLTFNSLWTTPRVITEPIMKLRIIIDANCIEMFIDEGLSSMSALFYSEEDIASKMIIEFHGDSSKKSYVHLTELNIYEMKSIWASR